MGAGLRKLSVKLRQSSLNYLQDTLVDRFDGGFGRRIGADCDDTQIFPLGDFTILGEGALVECPFFGLEAIFIDTFGLVANVPSSRPGERCIEIGQQEQREVGPKVATDRAVQRQYTFAAEPASAALIGFRRVGKAVAEDDVAGSERRPNDLVDRLRAVGEHERHLGEGSDILRFGVQQKGADLVAEFGAAGLARGCDGVVAGLERAREEPQLGGLAGTVQPFEGNEESTRHGGSVTLRGIMILIKRECQAYAESARSKDAARYV